MGGTNNGWLCVAGNPKGIALMKNVKHGYYIVRRRRVSAISFATLAIATTLKLGMEFYREIRDANQPDTASDNLSRRRCHSDNTKRAR